MKKTFEYLQDHFAKHRTTLTTIYSEHRAKRKQITDTYKPEAAEAQIARLIETSRARVAEADDRLSLALGVAADRMRSQLNRYATAPINRDLLDNLRALQDFGIKMNRAELEAYIKQAAGNLTALRCLAAIAEKSGMHLSFCGVDVLQEDIDKLERMSRTPMMVAPLEDNLLHEALEVLPDQPFFAPDGRLMYSTGRPTATQVVTQSTYLDTVEKKHLPAMIERWTHSIIPSVDEITARMVKENDGEQDDAHAEAAQKEHDTAVKAAAGAVDVYQPVVGLNHKTPEEREKEAELTRKVIARYS